MTEFINILGTIVDIRQCNNKVYLVCVDENFIYSAVEYNKELDIADVIVRTIDTEFLDFKIKERMNIK